MRLWDDDDDPRFADPAPPNPFMAWGLGVVAAAAAFAYGLQCIVRQTVYVPVKYTHSGYYLHGAAAVACGIAFVSFALWLHSHYFWSWRERYASIAYAGKLLGKAGAMGGLISVFLFH